jgi:hypothetical protein
VNNYTEELSAIAKEDADLFIEDIKELIQEKDTDRVKALVKECYDLKIEILKCDDQEETALIEEILEAKLGTMAHVLDSERIVVSREAAASLCRALKSVLDGFVVVGRELIKISVRAAVGGVAGGLLGTVGDKLADKASDLVDNLVDSAADSVIEKLSS